MSRSPGKEQRFRLGAVWWTHATIVTVLATAAGLMGYLTDPREGNIAAGLLGLVVGFLGLPWSLLLFAVPQPETVGNVPPAPHPWGAAGILASALINLAVHGWLRRAYLNRRRHPLRSGTPGQRD